MGLSRDGLSVLLVSMKSSAVFLLTMVLRDVWQGTEPELLNEIFVPSYIVSLY